MSRRSLLFIVTAILLCTPAFGKDPFTKKELPNGLMKNATLRLADRYYAESSFYTASENYKLYLTKKPDNRYARYWYAMSLYEARDYKGSEENFAAFYALKPTGKGKKENATTWAKDEREYFKLGRLYYGMALHRNGKYDEAQEQLHKFRSEYYTTNPDEQAALIKLAKFESEGCDSSRNAHKQKIKIKRLDNSINNAYTQAAPFEVAPDELIYTSVDGDTAISYTDNKNKHYAYIYQASREGGKNWHKSTKMSPVINEDKYFTGNGTYNADRSRFYFTKCLEMDDDRSLCNIFVSEVTKGKMSTPKRLPEGINFETKYTSTHPSVRTIDEFKEMVYYATDREGGKGGLDIWYTIRKSNGEFVAPEPLKGNINTAGDEVTPSFDDSTKILYFSTDGLPGLGGFDIFSAQLNDDDKSFQNPVNMGKPLNTGADELYYTRSKDETYGYFTSNREGSVPLNGISTASDDIYHWENLHFAVDGDVTKKNDPTANMTGARFNLYTTEPNGKKKLIAIDSTSKGGTYFFTLAPDKDYEVEVEKPGFVPTVTTLTTKGLDDEDTLVKNLQVAKDAFIVYGKIYEDDSSRMPAIMNAQMLIYEIKDGRELLFRELTAKDSFYYTVLPTERDFKILARKEGFFAGNTRLTTKGLSPGIDSVRADIKLKRVVINKEYKLSNILYEFDKATLTDPSKKVLDTLYDIMRENPSFIIELASHTDGKGSDPYNLRLSQARAQSCVDYLVKHGIEKRRMNPVGYGMRKPIAPNKNEDGSDNPEGRALNRRTEFKIVKM